MGAKLTRFRRWLAIKLCPELKTAEQKWLRLRNTLSIERHWLGYDYPEIDIYAFRVLVSDHNHWRAEDAPALPGDAGGIRWSDDISIFREQLRTHYPPRLALQESPDAQS